jgi:A/G-specific adenine glycosylase
MLEHGGQFPSSSVALQQLPGIGRSTAAAIAAFCFGERVAILDGNVKRVLTRVLAFGGDLAEAKHERDLWTKAEALLPERDIERYTQGLMDLGATVCTARSPTCLICPAQKLCAASAASTQDRYPVKTRKLKRSTREHVWVWLQWRDRIWLIQRPAVGVWAGLWSLPEFDSRDSFEAAHVGWPGAAEWLPSFTHTLTHLDWTLHPVRWSFPEHIGENDGLADLVLAWPNGRWFSLDEALATGLPAPLRKLLLQGN